MRIVQLLGAMLLLLTAPAMAKDGSAWVVTQKSGDVRVVRPGAQPASVQLRAVLSPGDVVATGANGRAVLTHEDDYVVVSPGSRLALPKDQQRNGFTRLLQQAGTMLYKVKHTGIPHFSVDTPMLAAVVKGTTFSVVVDDQRAAVQVTEGIVEVSATTGQARRLVEGGMTVYIGRERPDQIIEVRPGETNLPASGDDRAVKLEASGDTSLNSIGSLTGGLVGEALAVKAVVADPLKPVAAAPAVSDAGAPSVEAVQAVVTTATEPVVGVAETAAPAVAAPVVKVVETAVATVVTPVVAIVEPVVAPVVTPVVEIVQTVVTPVVAPVVTIVDPVIAPVVAPVVTIVQPVIAPVIAPVVPIVTPVVAPVTGLIGSLLGR